MNDKRCMEKDILLICKGYYNKEKYKSVEEAINGYYYKNYTYEGYYNENDMHENKDLLLSHKELNKIFIIPCIKYYLSYLKGYIINSFCSNLFDEKSLYENQLITKDYIQDLYGNDKENSSYEELTFDDILFYRSIKWLLSLKVKDIDLSEYGDNEIII